MNIEFLDIDGNILNIGDWCKVAHSRNRTNGEDRLLTFYAQLKLLPEGRIQPFDNFSFNQIHKISFDQIPKEAIPASDGYFVMYKGDEAEPEEKRQAYIMSYMSFNLDRQFYRITP